MCTFTTPSQVVLFHKLKAPVHSQYLRKPDIDAGNRKQAKGWDDGLFQLVNTSAEADAILYYAIGDSNDIYTDITAAARARWTYSLNPTPVLSAPINGGNKSVHQCKQTRVGKQMPVIFWLVRASYMNQATCVCNSLSLIILLCALNERHCII